jgi:apolipoprotein N-acyltransferase
MTAVSRARGRRGPSSSSASRVGPLLVPLALGGLAGVLLYAAHPPLGWAPAAFLVAPLLVAALRVAGGGAVWDVSAPSPSPARAAVPALAAGTIGYGAMIAWLIAPAGVLGWALLVGVQAAWIGIWAVVVAPFLRHPLLPVIAGGAWVGMDTLRGIVPLSGFSWGALAYSQVDVAWFLPLGRVLGASGITFVVVALGIALVETVFVMWTGDREDPSRPPIVQAVGLTLVVSLITVGPPPTDGTLDVMAVQGNDIEHWVAQVPDPPRAITGNLHRMTVDAIRVDGAPDLVVWPESAIDRDPSRPAWSDLGDLASEAALVAGTLVAGVSLDGPDPVRERIVGAWLLGAGGTAEIEDLYVKRRPVPFGEYVPGRRFLGWVPGLDQVPRDAVAGAGPQSFEVAPGVFAAVAICFETLFSDLVRTNVLAGDADAGLVLAITNDASFQRSAEPDQHLAQSRMRAIETGRWVVHAALSGSSAFIDPDGGVHDATGLFVQDHIRRVVPLAAGRTPFLAIGDVAGRAGAGLLVILLILVVWDRWGRRRHGSDGVPDAGGQRPGGRAAR